MNINPVAISFWNINIYWYSLAYIAGILLGAKYAKRLIIFSNTASPCIIDNFINVLVLGIIIGGRIGHVLLFDLSYYINNPIRALYVWEGGMSFHGGCVGVLIAIYYFAKVQKIDYWWFCDIVACCAPIGLFFGRIANFINQELYGTPTTSWVGVVFERVDLLKRHPTQLYEALLEGVLLFVIMHKLFTSKILLRRLSGVFAILYSSMRFFVEFFKEPDTSFNLLTIENTYLSVGQLMSCIFAAIGVLIILRNKGNIDVKDFKS